jgi:hypothetical protein
MEWGGTTIKQVSPHSIYGVKSRREALLSISTRHVRYRREATCVGTSPFCLLSLS